MVNGKFFEITTDHLGSIISIKDNGVEVVSREYGLWGERKVKVKSGHELIDKKIVWNYAGLIIPPNVDIKGLYWSTSRVYSSKLKHWLSVDPVILLNIDRMSQKINDLNAIRYCNNDPINFVDPSGYNSQYLQGLLNESSYRGEPARAMNAIKDAGKAVGYVAAGGVAVGAIAAVGPPLIAAATSKITGLTLAASIEYNAAIVGVGQYIARSSPMQIENIVGGGYSPMSGFAAGLSNTNTPKYDGNYSPGDITLNFFSSEAGNYLGSQIRSNYVQE